MLDLTGSPRQRRRRLRFCMYINISTLASHERTPGPLYVDIVLFQSCLSIDTSALLESKMRHDFM